MKWGTFFGAGLSLLALTASAGVQAADAQVDCLSEAEISAITIYVMPQLIAATQTRCKGQLSPEGFIATGGAAMAERYAARADQAWPLAKSAFMKFAGGSKDKDVDEFVKLPDAGMRPFLDAFFEQKIAEEIQPKSCRDIERFARVVSEIAPDTTGGLVAVIAALTLRDKPKPKICEAADS
jgi:hypothetical protein